MANSQYLGNDKYFATADAVNMLKAEYSLWMYTTQNGGDSYLTRASEALSAIGISSGRLLPDYSDVFSRTNKANSEIVFALLNDQKEKRTGGYYVYFYHPSNYIAPQYRNNPVPVSSTQWWCYSQKFMDVLNRSKTEHNDRRVACNLGEGEYGASGQKLTWPNKFLGDMSKQPVVNDCDLIYYRYAYAVMMDAELKFYQKDYTGALASLNIIAQRAYGVGDFYKTATRDAVGDKYVIEYLNHTKAGTFSGDNTADEQNHPTLKMQVQGICPYGWHIANTSDWLDIAYAACKASAGHTYPIREDQVTYKHLSNVNGKTTGLPPRGIENLAPWLRNKKHWASKVISDGADDFGFESFPLGLRYMTQGYQGYKNHIQQWIPLFFSDTAPFRLMMLWDNNTTCAEITNIDNGQAIQSFRCVKNYK